MATDKEGLFRAHLKVLRDWRSVGRSSHVVEAVSSLWIEANILHSALYQRFCLDA